MGKWPEWFRLWQQSFYHSKRWIALRDEKRIEARHRCAECGELIKGKGIVDHIEEITPDNYMDESITLNKANTRYICFECHNTKTFASSSTNFELNQRKEVNLF